MLPSASLGRADERAHLASLPDGVGVVSDAWPIVWDGQLSSGPRATSVGNCAGAGEALALVAEHRSQATERACDGNKLQSDPLPHIGDASSLRSR